MDADLNPEEYLAALRAAIGPLNSLMCLTGFGRTHAGSKKALRMAVDILTSHGEAIDSQVLAELRKYQG